jgi:hypothetical protein
MNGQDKIITVDNDTIICRILSVSDTHLNYEQTEGEYTVGKFIPVAKVLEYYKNTVKQDVLEDRPYEETDKTVQSYLSSYPDLYSHPKVRRFWRLNALFGGAYILASTKDDERSLLNIGIPASEVKKYSRQMKNGILFGADIYRFIDNPKFQFGGFGIGLKYRLSSFSSRLETVIPMSMQYHSFAENENIYVSYYAISSITHWWMDSEHKLNLSTDFSVGYAHYRNEMRFDETNTYIIDNGKNLLTTGNTVGLSAEVSLSYYPVEYLSISANMGFFAAWFRDLIITDGTQSQYIHLDDNNYLNASQLNYSIGVQFHF